MNVYVTYDRYENDEWFSVYNIETNKQRAIRHFKEIDLPDFISYGPDDCHSFQLQVVEMTKQEYLRFCKLNNENDEPYNLSAEFEQIMIDVFKECNWQNDNVLLCTDGCSDSIEIINYYCMINNLDKNNYEVTDNVAKILYEDKELYQKILKDYINAYY